MEQDEQESFPGYSSGKYEKFCGIKFLKMNNSNIILLGSWIINPVIPVSTVSAGTILAPFILWYITNHFSNSFVWILLILDFLFLYSYYRCLHDGPGYFPFYWALGEGAHWDNVDASDDDMLLQNKEVTPEGIITRKEQLDWARDHPKPNRSIVSWSARRIVIRPDHFCFWTSSWIGKRNNKFFILFTLYAGLLCCLLSALGFIICYRDYKAGDYGFFNFHFLAHLSFFVCATQLCLLSLSFSISSFILVVQGITNWERSNKINVAAVSKSTIENIEDVFGPRSKWYLYPSPFYSAWEGIPNDKIVENYPNYYDPPIISKFNKKTAIINTR